MPKILLSCLFSLGLTSLMGQLSIHALVSASSPMGITTAPQADVAFGISGFAGGELGYRFAKRFELRVFYATGIEDRSTLFGDYSISSELHTWGIKPQYNFFSSKNKVINIDMATPLSIWNQKRLWQRQEPGIFALFGNSASGEDKAQFFRFAIAPRLRFHINKARLNFEVGPNINLDKLLKEERTMHYDDTGENYATAKTTYQEVSVEFQLGIGYSFW